LLSGVVNWNTFSEARRRTSRTQYLMSCCIQCNSLYKDCEVYRGRGQRRNYRIRSYCFYSSSSPEQTVLMPEHIRLGLHKPNCVAFQLKYFVMDVLVHLSQNYYKMFCQHQCI